MKIGAPGRPASSICNLQFATRLSSSKSICNLQSPGGADIPVCPESESAGRTRPAERTRRTADKNICPTKARSSPGFTLLEMLTTVAVLVILLGLMVSLARYVRNALAVEVTKDLLHKLDGLMQQYQANHGGAIPQVSPFIPPAVLEGQRLDEQELQKNAERNNREFVRILRNEGLLSDESFGGLPQSIYNDATLRDAWGSPIVFMPSRNDSIGVAPQDRSFFFSAGPDRQYLTQDNNLYSYER